MFKALNAKCKPGFFLTVALKGVGSPLKVQSRSLTVTPYIFDARSQ